jgi:hypothetical protein
MTKRNEALAISATHQTGGSAQHSPKEIADLQAALEEFQARDATREEELKKLGEVVQKLTQMSSIECILTNGFEELSAKLAPLSDLTPKRTPLDEDGQARLTNLVDAWKRPGWSGATSLPVPNEPVFFIGAKAPPSCKGRMAP